jgi:hypothetical protein
MDEDKSKVDELSDTLYSRTKYQDPLDQRSEVREADLPEVEGGWQSPKLDDILSRERIAPPLNPFMKKFFTFAIFFFAATIIVAGFVFFGGANFVSSKNVDINIVGPTIATAGEVLELGVTIENGNNADLELANLSIQYPQGARDPRDSGKQLTFSKEDLGLIGAGDEAVRNVRLLLLGSYGEVKEIKFSVEYKVKGSNATFYKDKVYQITLGNAPLQMSVESPDSVASGEGFTTTVTLVLNSSEVLKNVMLRAEYPYGYSVANASPQPVSEDNVWELGDLTPGSRKKVDIQGTLVGENQDERTFRFYAGVGESGALNSNFRTVILSAQNTVAIERPSIGLSINFNGENTPAYVAPAGRTVAVAAKFQNNLPERLLNPRLEVRISGDALNLSSVAVEPPGTYSPSGGRANWLIYNLEERPELAPGESGTISFNFASFPDVIGSSAGKEINLQFIFTGTPAGSTRPTVVTETRTVKIASQVNLSSRATHSIGPFDNSGPIPPQVGKATSYSVVWSVGNTQGDLTNAKVTARLGAGVKWAGVKSTPEEKVSYDEGANTITWDLTTLASGTGFSAPAREIAFQVALTPTASQIGTAPVLVSAIAFSGTDTLTSRSIVVSAPALTTKLTSDPAFIQGDEIVVK